MCWESATLFWYVSMLVNLFMDKLILIMSNVTLVELMLTTQHSSTSNHYANNTYGY
jgi:hypothetical protein